MEFKKKIKGAPIFKRNYADSCIIVVTRTENIAALLSMLELINFKFPVYYYGEVGKEIRLLNENTAGTEALSTRKIQ